MDDTIRRAMPLFSMSIVQKLTGLTARQVRYYEEHRLILPDRTEGNRRVFSYNNVERLLEIKSLLDEGVNLAGIKHVLGLNSTEANQPPEVKKVRKDLSDADLMKYLKSEMIYAGKFGKDTLRQGELSRFFH